MTPVARGWALAAVPLCGTLLLGGLWLADQTHRWETPSWRPELFTPLGGPPDGADLAAATWLVAVRPGCGRCVTAAWRLHAGWPARGGADRLAVLVVDTAARPGRTVLEGLPPVPVWWDRDGVWRRRWGHRIYGEVIGFDRAGHCLGTVAPGHAPPGAARAGRRASPAPVVEPEGT